MIVSLSLRIWLLLSLTSTSLCTGGISRRCPQSKIGTLGKDIDSAIAVLQSELAGKSDVSLANLGGLLGEGTSGSVRLLHEPDGYASKYQIAVKSFWDVDSNADICHEFSVASSLNHPNIIRTFDLRKTFNGTHTTYHQFMEYLPYDLPAFTAAFPHHLPQKYRIFWQVCQGVAYLHNRGLAHLDLKPENVLVSNEGIAKIIDFGSSEAVPPVPLSPPTTCVVTGHNVPTHGIRGSEPYMPPEVYGEAKYDGQKADVWALGILFVQIALDDYRMPWSFSAMEDEAFASFVGATIEVEEEEEEEKTSLGKGNKVSLPVRMSREELLRHLPRGSRDMVRRMLYLDPGRRPVIEEVLGDPWLDVIT